jgi:hypothetical protein
MDCFASLAMTAERPRRTLSRHHPRRRAIQYPRGGSDKSRSRRVLDRPVKPDDDISNKTLVVPAVSRDPYPPMLMLSRAAAQMPSATNVGDYGSRLKAGTTRSARAAAPSSETHTAFSVTRNPSSGFGIGYICQSGV